MSDTPSYNTILTTAAKLGDLEIVDLALKRGATNAVETAISVYYVDVFEQIISRLLEHVDTDKNRVLIIKSRPSMLLDLLKAGRVMTPLTEIYVDVCSCRNTHYETGPLARHRTELLAWIIEQLKVAGAGPDVFIRGLVEAIYTQDAKMVRLAWAACEGIEDRAECIVSPKYSAYRLDRPKLYLGPVNPECIELLAEVDLKFHPALWEYTCHILKRYEDHTPWDWMTAYVARHPEVCAAQ